MGIIKYRRSALTVITGPPSGETVSRGILHFLHNQNSADSNDVMMIQNVKMETFLNNSDKLQFWD